MAQIEGEATQTLTAEIAEFAPQHEERTRKAGHRGMVATYIDPVNLGIRRAPGSTSTSQRGFNNEFDLPQEPAFPAPRDVEDDTELSWQKDALCAQTDPEAFFPEKGGSTRDAKKVCASCDVRDQCLDYALQNDERFGIWGGLSERERRKLKRRVS